MRFTDAPPVPSLIYRYGLRWPDRATCERLIDEMRLANRYYNALVEIYQRKHAAVTQARRYLFPDFERLETREAELDAAIAAARALIKATNAAAKRKQVAPEQRDKIAALKAVLAQVRAELKEQRAALKTDPALQAAWSHLEETARAEIKAARAARECSWGTGGEIEAAVDQAAKKSHGNPRFRRWDGGGKFAVQIQGGMSVEEAFGGENTQCRIDDLPHRDTIDRVPRSHRMTTLHLRIGSEGRQPVWVSVPLIYHRPLPPDARIKRVYIRMYYVGKRQKWECGFTLSRESGWAKEGGATDGGCGIDVGWRLIDKGLRVAYIAGSDGRFSQVVLPYEWLDRWKQIEERQGARDRAFDAARNRLADWLDTLGEAAPEWLRERTQSLRLWRSADRLWRLVGHWRGNRFAGDEEMHDWMLSWWREERREHDGIEGQRRRQIGWRDTMYREVAVTLRQRYRTAYVESLDWARMQQRSEPEEGAEDGGLKHHMRNAAVGRFLTLLREHMTECIGVPAKDTTRKCQACGFVLAVDSESIEVECERCGILIDQDKRAAINLLAAGLAASAEVAEAVS